METRARRWSDIEHRVHALPLTSEQSKQLDLNASASSKDNTSNVVTLSVMQDAVPVQSGSDDPDECVICLDELISGRAVFTAECGHKFHFSCLLENVNHDEANSDKCPICRKPQAHWPEQTKGLVKAHPYCTNCGKRGAGGQYCDGCGHSLAHTPTAQERARQSAATTSRNNVVVECPSCRVRCLVNTNARGTLQCPNGHLFQLRMPATSNTLPPPPVPSIGGLPGPSVPAANSAQSPQRPVMRQCPTCFTRVQMPLGSRAGQYMCPHGHTFFYNPTDGV